MQQNNSFQVIDNEDLVQIDQKPKYFGVFCKETDTFFYFEDAEQYQSFLMELRACQTKSQSLKERRTEDGEDFRSCQQVFEDFVLFVNKPVHSQSAIH